MQIKKEHTKQPYQHQRNSSTEQLKDLMPTNVIEDRAASIGKTKSSEKTRKQAFHQTAINNQRPKPKIQISGIERKVFKR